MNSKNTIPSRQIIKLLLDREYEPIKWELFKEFDLVRIRTPPDGSCFFHALTKAYFKPYITGNLNGRPFNRKNFITQLRKDLAIKLGSKIDITDPESMTYYQSLSRGELENISKSLPGYSLENMQRVLDSNLPVDNVYNEFISDQFKKDIYILDYVKQDVYITGDDNDILYKNRPSIIILYLPGHYELIGLKQNNIIHTLFDHRHKLIQTIRNRMSEIQK